MPIIHFNEDQGPITHAPCRYDTRPGRNIKSIRKLVWMKGKGMLYNVADPISLVAEVDKKETSGNTWQH